MPATEPVAGAVEVGAVVAGAMVVVGAAVVVVVVGAVDLAGAVLCCAKALIGRTARAEATNRLEMRVMVGFLNTGGLVPAEEDKAIGL